MVALPLTSSFFFVCSTKGGSELRSWNNATYSSTLRETDAYADRRGEMLSVPAHIYHGRSA